MDAVSSVGLGLVVLVVEDDPGDARLVRAFLTSDNSRQYTLVRASTLGEALDLARSGQRFDIILTDLGLPDSDGLDTVDSLKEAFPDIPIMVLTGVADRGLARLAVQRGCQEFLVKGEIDVQILQRLVGHAIERDQATRRLRDSEARYRTVVEQCPDAILVIGDGRILSSNRAATAALGAVTDEVLMGLSPERFLGSLIGAEWWSDGVGTGSRLAERRVERTIHRLDGTSFEAEVTICQMVYGGRRAIQVLLRDVSAAKQAARDYLLASAVFNTTDEGVVVTDGENRIVAVNPAFQRLTGYSAAEIKGRTPHCLSSGRHDADFYARMWRELLQVGHWRGELWNRRRNGEVYVQRATLSVVRDSTGTIVNHIGVFSDITDAKVEAERVRYRASYDALTDLPNRTLLYDRMQIAIAKTTRERGRLAVLFLDLDGFKDVNDRRGHLAGDLLLTEVAKRLKSCVRESDTVARLGGDEFVLLLPDIICVADAQLIAAKVLSALSIPFRAGSHEAALSASVGIAVYPDHGHSVDALLDAADKAMYRAKQGGKARYMLAAGTGPA